MCFKRTFPAPAGPLPASTLGFWADLAANFSSITKSKTPPTDEAGARPSRGEPLSQSLRSIPGGPRGAPHAAVTADPSPAHHSTPPGSQTPRASTSTAGQSHSETQCPAHHHPQDPGSPRQGRTPPCLGTRDKRPNPNPLPTLQRAAGGGEGKRGRPWGAPCCDGEGRVPKCSHTLGTGPFWSRLENPPERQGLASCLGKCLFRV